jgi:hypothetical protein
MTGIGAVAVRHPRVRNREADSVRPDHSATLCPAHEGPRSADPDPLLESISTGDFKEALGDLLCS